MLRAGSTVPPGDALFVAGAALLLLPLALFWISVATRSEVLSRFLFGSEHTPLRDVVPFVVLAAAVLGGIVWRLRRDLPESGAGRTAARVLALFVALSLAGMFVYLLGENAAHASRPVR